MCFTVFPADAPSEPHGAQWEGPRAEAGLGVFHLDKTLKAQFLPGCLGEMLGLHVGDTAQFFYAEIFVIQGLKPDHLRQVVKLCVGLFSFSFSRS